MVWMERSPPETALSAAEGDHRNTRVPQPTLACFNLSSIASSSRSSFWTRMAALFLPSCSNLSAETEFNKWSCNTCPYQFPIMKTNDLSNPPPKQTTTR